MSTNIISHIHKIAKAFFQEDPAFQTSFPRLVGKRHLLRFSGDEAYGKNPEVWEVKT